MLREDAEIIGHTEETDYGHIRVVRYEWQGGKIALLSSWQVGFRRPLSRGQVVTLKNLRLRVVSDRLHYADGVLVMRDGRKARLWAHVYPLARWLSLVKSRLIWTAGVWGLADVTPGAILRWRNIHVVKMLAEAFGR